MSSYAGRNIIVILINIEILIELVIQGNRMVSPNCKYIIDIRNLFVIRTTEIILSVSLFTVNKIITNVYLWQIHFDIWKN